MGNERLIKQEPKSEKKTIRRWQEDWENGREGYINFFSESLDRGNLQRMLTNLLTNRRFNLKKVDTEL